MDEDDDFQENFECMLDMNNKSKPVIKFEIVDEEETNENVSDEEEKKDFKQYY